MSKATFAAATSFFKHDVDVSGNLELDGTATLNSSLAVTGTSAFTGNATFANDLTVTGELTAGLIKVDDLQLGYATSTPAYAEYTIFAPSTDIRIQTVASNKDVKLVATGDISLLCGSGGTIDFNNCECSGISSLTFGSEVEVTNSYIASAVIKKGGLSTTNIWDEIDSIKSRLDTLEA